MKKGLSFLFQIPLFGIHFWLLWNASLFIVIYLKRLIWPLNKTSKGTIKILLVYQSPNDLEHLKRQFAYLEQIFGAYHIQVIGHWKSLDPTLDFSRTKRAGLFWNLFYTELYLIYFKYLKILLQEFREDLVSKNGMIICSLHDRFHKDEKISIVGFSRGFPFSHVVLSKKGGEHVLAHEIGHTCGLWHSKDKSNLMYALTPKLPVQISDYQNQIISRARYVF